MSTLTEITTKALELPVEQRVSLAQKLWDSVEEADLPALSEEEWNEILRQRRQDQPDGNWKSHKEMMTEARREFGCSTENVSCL
jgi:hypothetical protein